MAAPETLPAHSPLGASSAERWMNCPGSVALLKRLELPETDEPDYRANGIAAHEAAAHCLETGKDAWEVMGEKFHNVAVDAEIAEAIQLYFDTVRPLMALPGAKVYIEERVTHPDHRLFYGTVDHGVVYSEPMKTLALEGAVLDAGNRVTLEVTDYKHGEGIVVEVEDNPQVMYYAYGLLRLHPEVTRVILRIVQPRGFHHLGPVREWETTADYIRDWAAEELLPAMNRVELDHDLDAGPWCRFCPAKLVCPLMTALFGAACNANPKLIVNLSDESLGRSYQYTQAVKFYLKAMEEETLRRLNLGGAVPGTKLVHKKANRVWKPGAKEIFEAKFGPSVLTEPEFKTPAEMEKLGATAKELVHEHAYTPESGLTVALADDKRVAVIVKKSQEVFGAAIAALAGPEGPKDTEMPAIPDFMRRNKE